MKRDDPGLDQDLIARHLLAEYGLQAREIVFMPLGYDMNAAVFNVVAEDNFRYFLKIRFGTLFEPGLAVPRALSDAGVPGIVAPIPTRAGALWTLLTGIAGATMVLYPFIAGRDAKQAGLTAAQWREYGAALRAVHECGLAERFRNELRVEEFDLPTCAEQVRRWLNETETATSDSPARQRLAQFWREEANRIGALLERAETLGRALRAKPFELTLCHADIHAANILAGDNGRVWLVDWDGPIIAPRERDLLFVIGSYIARTVEPAEETAFFSGYGPVTVDPEALIYYRHERLLEDLAAIADSVFLDPHESEEMRWQEVNGAIGMFTPGSDIDRLEPVDLSRVPIL